MQSEILVTETNSTRLYIWVSNSQIQRLKDWNDGCQGAREKVVKGTY